jgi:hypothetical protein
MDLSSPSNPRCQSVIRCCSPSRTVYDSLFLRVGPNQLNVFSTAWKTSFELEPWFFLFAFGIAQTIKSTLIRLTSCSRIIPLFLSNDDTAQFHSCPALVLNTVLWIPSIYFSVGYERWGVHVCNTLYPRCVYTLLCTEFVFKCWLEVRLKISVERKWRPFLLIIES